ncbi:MAG: ABC transporter permease [Candidatus Heimdallarchaeaceae archaeon]
MVKKSFNTLQFKAILKKDLSLLFRKKIALFIFGGPFVLMFVMFVLPSIFIGTDTLTLVVFNEDIGYQEINIGDAIVGNLSVYYSSNTSDVNIRLVNNLSAVLGADDLGLYIPSNFSNLSFTSYPQLFFVDTQKTFFSETQIAVINNICMNVMTTMLANRTIPDIESISLTPSVGEGEVFLSAKAAIVAYPLSYMIFLLIALNSSSNSLIGFAREKRMRTMEIILAYTYNHKLLIISKAITGVVASLGSTLSYILGIVSATLVFSAGQDESLFSIFAINLQSLSFLDVFFIFLAVVTALVISTLMTMAVDCNLAREASERLSPLVSIGFSFFFYFMIIVNPFAFNPSLLANPFYWPYRITLLLISGKFNFEVILYLSLIVLLLVALIGLATRGIEKEKSLYLD